ncbi:hypothetical protein LTR37_014937 [Vermiconidia calcicola]|uniref:Uncharacterized protein n=1 Tax=Vermiconidia calcicola TaxID=1690605 RepID=A0ACC3MTK6_9PEZI|nr:hypothetical protein LTR37_014937 [Vermiconidia calcicola]
MSSQGELSFGIELEFILVTTCQNCSAERALSRRLSELVSTTCSLPGCRTNHTHRLKVSTNAEDIQCWTIGADLTVKMSEEELRTVPKFEESFRCYPVEVRSPAFLWDATPSGLTSKGHLPDDHNPWFSPPLEISRALQLLNSVNQPMKDNGILRIYTNASSGLHVHVGSGVPSKGFSLQTVKNVLGFATIFERQLDSVQSVTRIGGSPLALRQPTPNSYESTQDLKGTPRWCRPLSVHHARRTYRSIEIDSNIIPPSGLEMDRYPLHRYGESTALHEAGSTQNAMAWSQVIQSAECLFDLEDLFNSSRFPKDITVNILNLSAGQARKTIEFRQHAGTLEFEEIMAWVGAAVQTVDWCRCGKEEYLALVNSKWDDLSFSFPDLLRCIGATDDVVDHYNKVIKPMGSDYADQRYAEAMRIEHLHLLEDPLTPLVFEVESTRQRSRTARAVREHIEFKLLSGGYGRYPRSALGSLSQHPQAHKLAIGPRVGWAGFAKMQQETSSCRRDSRRESIELQLLIDSI